MLHAGSLRPVCMSSIDMPNPICPLVCSKMPPPAWYSDPHLAVMCGWFSVPAPWLSRLPASPAFTSSHVIGGPAFVFADLRRYRWGSRYFVWSMTWSP